MKPSDMPAEHFAHFRPIGILVSPWGACAWRRSGALSPTAAGARSHNRSPARSPRAHHSDCLPTMRVYFTTEPKSTYLESAIRPAAADEYVTDRRRVWRGSEGHGWQAPNAAHLAGHLYGFP